MKAAGEFSYREIKTQAESWQGALERTCGAGDRLGAVVTRNAGSPIVFIGCGSTHYLAQFAANCFQHVTGLPCRGLASSELLWQRDAWLTSAERPLVVALSRSGETSETVWALEAMRACGCDTLGIGCYADSPVGRTVTLMLELPEGREQSYAQTRSFAGMLLAVQMLAARVAENHALQADLLALPALCAELIARAETVARRWGTETSIQRITYLGSGCLYGLANEATVKMKEMSLSVAEGYHFLEFRHGPMALVDQEHLVVGLLSAHMRNQELAVLGDLQERGAKVLAVANGAVAGHGFAESFDLQADVCETACAVLYLPFIQLLAYYRALARGLNPDRPRNVSMAIKLDRSDLSP